MSARMKDKERLERLSTVRAAEKDMKEELQEKIQQKQASPTFIVPVGSRVSVFRICRCLPRVLIRMRIPDSGSRFKKKGTGNRVPIFFFTCYANCFDEKIFLLTLKLNPNLFFDNYFSKY